MSIPKKRPQPGPGALLTTEREQYRRLMAQGLNNYQACLQIGVHPEHWFAVEQGPQHGRPHRQSARTVNTCAGSLAPMVSLADAGPANSRHANA